MSLGDFIFDIIKHGDEKHQQWLREKSYEIEKAWLLTEVEATTALEERIEVVECLAKRICRDLRHALDDVPVGVPHKAMMVQRYEDFKKTLGDTSEYVHDLHYQIRRLSCGILKDISTERLQEELGLRSPLEATTGSTEK